MADPGRIVHVTPFPHSSRRVHGVACVGRQLARALHDSGLDVEVWADRSPSDPDPLDQVAIEDGLRVVRNWRPGPLAGVDLSRALRERPPALVHVQIEPFVFGGMAGYASLLTFLLAARLTGIPIFATIHHVPAGASMTHDVLREAGIWVPRTAVQWLLHLSTRFLSSVANRLIVHDEVFRHRLVTEFGVNPWRVEVIHHGVPHCGTRERTGSPANLLMFGYLKWYKGIDIALEAFRMVAPEFPESRLVIAGGVAAGAGRQSSHRRFMERIKEIALPLGTQVEFLGYVDDGAIPRLFDASTLVLFPYRLLFGASGPLALAVGYRKPFIVSDVLKPLVPFWPLTAQNTPESWADAIRLALTAPSLQESAEDILGPVASMRQWSRVASAVIETYRAESVPRATFDVS